MPTSATEYRSIERDYWKRVIFAITVFLPRERVKRVAVFTPFRFVVAVSEITSAISAIEIRYTGYAHRNPGGINKSRNERNENYDDNNK